jgi:hypothetical protein
MIKLITRLIIFVGLLVTITNCGNNLKPDDKDPVAAEQIKKDSISFDSSRKIITDSPSIDSSKKMKTDTVASLKIDLRTAKKIEILSIEKEINNNMDQDSACQGWSLTREQITIVIRKFKKMSSELQYLSYSFFPCEIKGIIRIDGHEFKYYLGAGSTLTLNSGSTSFYFGCSDHGCKKYFLAGEEKKGDIE